jgi:hypothetical protein
MVGFVILLLPVRQLSAQEVEVEPIIRVRDQRLRLVQLDLGIGIALQPNVDGGQRLLHILVVRRSLQLRIGQRQPLVYLTGIRQLLGIRQLDLLVLGQGRSRLRSRRGRFLPLVRGAVRVHFALVAARDEVAAQANLLLICLHRVHSVVLLAVDDAQPIQEDRTIRPLAVRVLAIRLRR